MNPMSRSRGPVYASCEGHRVCCCESGAAMPLMKQEAAVASYAA